MWLNGNKGFLLDSKAGKCIGCPGYECFRC